MSAVPDQSPSVFQELSGRYREVLFSSVITSFGLDALLFSNDEANGHVDTIHNVAKSAKNGENPTFKRTKHADAYARRGEYESAQYHSDSAYIAKGKEWNKERDAGNLRDAYTGKTIKPGDKYDRDHVVAAKTIHDDPRRALSSLNGVDLANQSSNLQPTDRSINRSKQADSAEVFLIRLQKQRESNLAEAASLRKSIVDGSAPDGAEKKLKSLEAKLVVDETKLKEATHNAERAMSRQHNVAYYTSKDFIGATSKHALAAGFKMGARQGLGVVLLELSVAVQEEFPSLIQRWQQTPTWKEKLDLKPILEHVATVLRNAWERIKGRLSHIWSEMKSGFTAGVLSEIVTTIINIFTGTAKKAMKMLRSFWSAIVTSLRILIYNPDNLGQEEKLAAVMRLLSIAVGAVIQPIISEAIDKLIMTYASVLPGFLREVLSEFAGAAVGGMISVTLAYAIDNSPLVLKVVEIAHKIADFTDATYQKIAHITGIFWQNLKSSIDTLTDIANSPAVDLAAFVACPPLGVALYFNRRLNRIETTLSRVEQGQEQIKNRIESLNSTMRTGFASVERLVRENTALLHCVIDGQERQMTLLAEIRNQLRSGFAEMHDTIHLAKLEGVELSAIRQLQENLNELLANYRDCAAILERGEFPLKRDLEKIEELASSLIGKFQTRFNDQRPGSPARLPLLTGMTFALSTWRDARNALGDGLEMCFQRARVFAELALRELHALTGCATLWELAQENSWLTGQYILLRRTLIKMPSSQRTFEIDTDDNLVPATLSFTLIGWNDGLQRARDLIEYAKAEEPLSVLPVRTFDDRHGWQKLMGLPRGTNVNEIPMTQLRHRLGIPAEVTLGASALELMREAPALIENNRLALAQAFS
ncbi:hypothetical protein ABDK75_06520 [Gluconobacter sp. OJA]|uniref:hypothetical protein n=1 Tax=Gluconobacter sp. OJA TaxID=3145197 RepID=UPI0031F88ADA